MDDIRDVAKLYDIFVLLGLDPRKRVYLCPLPQHVHQNNTPSFSVRTFRDGKQRFRCFGNCGLGGDCLDLVGYMEIPNYDPKDGRHVRMAAARLQGEEIHPPEIEKKKTSIPAGLWQKFYPPGPKVINYAKSRGLTEATLEKFKIGQKKFAMAIPVFENGQLMMIKYRSTARKPKFRYWTEEGSVASLFNFNAVAYRDDPVIVAKGEIPVMLLDQYGIVAAAPTTGEERSDMSQWAHLFAFCKKVVVVTDNDPDPEVRKRITAKAELRAKCLNGELMRPPEQWKDIDSWILADPGAIDVIRGWLL